MVSSLKESDGALEERILLYCRRWLRQKKGQEAKGKPWKKSRRVILRKVRWIQMGIGHH